MLAAGAIDQPTANRIERTMDPEAMRVWAEAELQRAFTGGLNAQQGRLIDLLRDNPNPTAAQWDRFWAGEGEALWAATGDTLTDVASEMAILQASTADLAGTFSFINQQTTDWVHDYYINADVANPGAMGQLNLTSRTRFAQTFQDWRLGELETGGAADGLPQLIRATADIFGPVRGEMIAVTETTRIRAESQRQIEEGEESTTFWRVLTTADDRVCEICGPLHGQVQPKVSRTFDHPSLGAISGPPFHVRCRCSITPLTDLTRDIAPLGDDFVHDGPLPEPKD